MRAIGTRALFEILTVALRRSEVMTVVMPLRPLFHLSLIETLRAGAELRAGRRAILRTSRRTSALRSPLRRAEVTPPILRAGTPIIPPKIRRTLGLWAGTETIHLRSQRIPLLQAAIDGLLAIFPRLRTGTERRPRRLRCALCKSVSIRRGGAVMMVMVVLPLRLPTVRALRRSAGAFATRPVARRLRFTPAIGTVVARSACFRSATTIAVARRLFGACFWTLRSTLPGFGAGTAITFPARLFGARTAGLGALPLRTARLLAVAAGAQFIESELAVAIAIELAEDVGGVRHLGGIDHPVVVRIERGEKSAAGLPAFVRACGARAAVRARATFASSAVGWARGGIVLGAERPRGKREDERSQEHGAWLHGQCQIWG